MFEFTVVEVTRPQRHDQVAQANQRGVGISKKAHHHMISHHFHGRLILLLKEDVTSHYSYNTNNLCPKEAYFSDQDIFIINQ